MRKLLVRQLFVFLLSGILLLPVLGKALHQLEAHTTVLLPSGKHHLHTLQSECSVCKYVQLSFFDDFKLVLPVLPLASPEGIFTLSSSVFQPEAFQLHLLRAPPTLA